MNSTLLFKTSVIVEVLTGLALLVAPLFVIGLLLGDGLDPTGVAVARVLGIGLLSLGAMMLWVILAPGNKLNLKNNR